MKVCLKKQSDVEGIDQVENGGNGWSKWIRQWTGEENRHGEIGRAHV